MENNPRNLRPMFHYSKALGVLLFIAKLNELFQFNQNMVLKIFYDCCAYESVDDSLYLRNRRKTESRQKIKEIANLLLQSHVTFC